MTPKLSPNKSVGFVTGTPRHHNIYRIEMASSTADCMEINSAQYVLVAMHLCRLLVQITGVLPTKTINPEIERRVT